MYRAYSSFYDRYGAATPDDRISNSAFQNRTAHSPFKGCADLNTKGIVTGSPPGTDDYNSPRVSTAELVDFTKEQAKRRPIKEVARLTGLSLKAVESIRSGEAAASGTTISTWCRNCPQFRTDYFRFVGGHLEIDPEGVAALYSAINFHIRKNGNNP